MIELFDYSQTIAGDLISTLKYPWGALEYLSKFILEAGEEMCENYTRYSDEVWIEKSAVIMEGAHIFGPCIIGAESCVRPGAFIRGNAIIGERCVIGNSTEIKNSILFNEVKAPHYNYIGDSILGRGAHLGAGVIISNVKGDKSPVSVCTPEGKVSSGRHKLGAMIGDLAEIGSGCVLNPGCTIGRGTRIYPLLSVRGYVPGNSIFKGQNEIVPIKNM